MSDSDSDWEEEIQHTRTSLLQEQMDPWDDPIRAASPKEILDTVKVLKEKRAPGPDAIQNKAIKLLPIKGIATLTMITNNIFRLCYFPKLWRNADVVMIPKPGKNHSLTENYRPIHLLPTVAKVVERIIKSRLEEYIEDHNILPEHQFAFRRGLGTELQALRVVETIKEGFQKKDITGAVLLDVQKAFDRVWREALIYKMIDLGIPRRFIKITDSFLQGRTFQIKIDQSRSTTRNTEAGVPQGAVLSPTLFSIYVADLPNFPGVEVAQFADDTLIMATSRAEALVHNRLQGYLDVLEGWTKKWRIKINAEKSTAVLFTRRRIKPSRRIKFKDSYIRTMGTTDEVPWDNHGSEADVGCTYDVCCTQRKGDNGHPSTVDREEE